VLYRITDAILPYLPYIGYALPFIFGLVALGVNGRLKGFAREAVAAIYRAAIHTASEVQEEGLTWLRSEAGIAYRKELAQRAYDALPAHIRGVPVGLVKLVVSREAFVAYVEAAFQAAVEIAEKLELPAELPEYK
jgi:hypothetical protein